MALVAFLFLRSNNPRPAAAITVKPAAPSVVSAPKLITESIAIKRGDTLDDLLNRAGVEPGARVQMTSELNGVFDVRKFRAGASLTLVRRADRSIDSLQYAIDPDHELQLRQTAGAYRASVVEIAGAVHAVPVCATVHGSLFTTMEQAGERPELALRIAEIFAWDIDFYTDPQDGDQICVLVEKKVYENGQPPTYRNILAARYNNAGTEYEGFLFPDSNGRPAYYSRNGRSLQAAFLRSPLKFEAAVSSHFTRRRFHPVLKVFRPHLGTDYAAPTGSPVQAVSSGRITFAGRAGGAGNMVRIQHANGYESMYLHLSRILVKRGQHVAQGQRIALVGATGLATGPHLDFRLRRNGQYVNFERFRPPRAAQLTAAEMRAFSASRDRYVSDLDRAEHEGDVLAASAGEAPDATSVD
jgi:hypothetical protein